MDLDESPADKAFRTEVSDWLAQNAPPFSMRQKLPLADEVALGRRWQAHKAAAGYGALHWPSAQGGREVSPTQLGIFREEESHYAIPNRPYVGIGLGLAMPTLFTHGTPEQIKRFAGPTQRAEITWCQLFSEPGAGSDLAGLTTRAVRTGEGWVVNGQKVWNSFAAFADWGILLARSDPSAPKHNGLTFFVLDMKTPGVEVRPIRQMTGGAEFCEVFFTDVFIPDENRIAEERQGWKVALTTLSNERFGMGGAGRRRPNTSTLKTLASQAEIDGVRAIDDPVVRQRIAHFHAKERAVKFFGHRLATKVARGQPLGAEVSINKLIAPRLTQDMGALAMEICGYSGLVEDEQIEPGLQSLHEAYLLATAHRIAGGTDEIMRNQIAEKVLGLPQDVRLDKGVPFNELK